MAGNVAPNIVTDGLVLYLDAANTKSYPGSGTTWLDLSGNGYNGELVNGPTFDNGNGGYIVLDNVDDIVQMNSSAISSNFIDQLSASIFFKPYDLTSTFNLIFYPTPNATFRLYRNAPGTSPGTLTWLLYYFDTTNTLRSIIRYISYTNNEWASTSVSVYNDGTVRFFKNGNFVDYRVGINFQNWDITPRTNINDRISIRATNISNLKFYNRALTDQEILQNYNATKGRFGL